MKTARLTPLSATEATDHLACNTTTDMLKSRLETEQQINDRFSRVLSGLRTYIWDLVPDNELPPVLYDKDLLPRLTKQIERMQADIDRYKKSADSTKATETRAKDDVRRRPFSHGVRTTNRRKQYRSQAIGRTTSAL